MSDLELVVSLLKDKLSGVGVYTGEIPESQEGAAVVVKNVANIYTRTLSGRKVQKNSTWRITVVAKLQSDVELVIGMLEDIDNIRTVDFQRVFTNLVMTELGLIEQPFRRAFYDLTVYK